MKRRNEIWGDNQRMRHTCGGVKEGRCEGCARTKPMNDGMPITLGPFPKCKHSSKNNYILLNGDSIEWCKRCGALRTQVLSKKNCCEYVWNRWNLPKS